MISRFAVGGKRYPLLPGSVGWYLLKERHYGWHFEHRTTKDYCTCDDDDFIFIILGVIATFWQSVIDEPSASAYNRSKDGIGVKKLL